MPLALKTSGVATALIACVTVDDDGTTVKDFVANRAGTYAGSGTGTKNWKGTSRRYFNVNPNGGHDFLGWTWTTAAGAALPPVDYTSGGLSFYAAVASRIGIGDDGPMFDTTAQNGAMMTSQAVQHNWTTSFNIRLAGVADPPAAGTSYSVGGYYLSASAATDIMFGLESGSIASDAAGSPGGFGSAAQTLGMLGGSSGGGYFESNWHIAAFFNRDLTTQEWTDLHTDWFGTLFQTGGTTNTKVMSDAIVIADAQIHQALRNRIASDSIVLTDAQFHWVRVRRTAEDSLVIADAIVKSVLGSGTTFTKVMSDSLTIADSQVNWLVRRRLVEDAIVVGDFLVYWLRRVRLTGDVVLVVEDSLQKVYVITGTDTVDLTDSLAYWRRNGRLASDNIVLTDAALAGRRITRVSSDNVVVADGVLTWRRLFRVLDEAITVIDSKISSVTGLGTVYTKVMTDTVDLAVNELLKSTLRFRQVGDALDLADALVKYRLLGRTGEDTVAILDTVSKVMRYVRVLGDNVALIDSVLSNYMPIVTYDVGSFKLGADADPIHLGADPGIRFGGY